MSFTVPIPARALLWTLGGAFAFLALVLLGGAAVSYALLAFAAFLFLALAFGAQGGWRTLNGICVAMLALKFLLVSQVAKVILGEPGDHNLDQALITMGVLAVGSAALLAAALVARGFAFHRPVMVAEWDAEKLRSAALLALGIGTMSYLVLKVAGGVRIGGVFGVLKQFLFLQGLAVALGTAWTIVHYRGRRLFSWLNAVPFLIQFAAGFIDAGRMKMIEPVVLVLLTAVAYGFRFRWTHFAAGLAAVLFTGLFLIPFGHVARNQTRHESFAANLVETGAFLYENFATRAGWEKFYAEYDDSLDDLGNSYFDEPHGLLDRLSLIKPMDLLVDATLRGGESGWETVTHGLAMLPPRMLYPQKPPIGTGSMLGQKAGVLTDEDEGTQITFGFIADAFSSFGWAGAAIIPFVIGLGFFLVYGKLVGPLAGNVWCVGLAAHFQHYFAENNIAAMVLTIAQQSLVFLAAYYGLKLACQYSPARVLAAWRGPELAVRPSP